jgi:RNA polymerase sigma-70 factor (ECF subfamily)
MNEIAINAGAVGADASDALLVESFRAGNRLAFDRLVLRHRDRITRLCAYLLGDRDEGEDAAQDSFVKAFRALPRFQADASFATWIYRIAVNSCRSRQRSWWGRLSRRAMRLDRPTKGEGDGEAIELGDTRHLPARDLQRHRTVQAIRRGLRKMPAHQRELVVLRDIQELSYEEIQKITGLAAGTVKSRIARARGALREHLKGKIDHG